MAIEGDVQAVLAALVGGRCYPMVAPDNTVRPYIIFLVVSNVPEVTLDGPVDTENRRIQIDVYDPTYSGVKTLELAIKAAMIAASFTNIPLVSRETYESETKLYRISLDYSIWT